MTPPLPPPPPEDLDPTAVIIRRWDLYFALAFGLAIGFNLVVVWATTWLPMGDIGGWIELIDVVARHGDPATLYAEHYALPTGFEPNSLVVHVGSWLAHLMPAHLAAKVLLSFYVVGLPVGVLMVAEAFGRSRWLSLFAAPMTFSALFNLGVLNFLVAMPLMFMLVAMSRTHLRHPTIRSGVALSLTFIALFYAHVLAFLMTLGLVAPVFILGIRSRRALLQLAVLAPSIVLFAAWVFRKYVQNEATEAGARLVGDGGLELAFTSLNHKLEQFHAWALRYFRDGADEALTLILGLSWLGLMTASQHRAIRVEAQRVLDWLRASVLELITVGCLLAYFALPSHMREIELIAERVVIPFLLFLVLLPRLRLERTRAHVFIVPVVIAALVYPWVAHHRFRRFEAEDVGALPQLIANLPPRSRLVYVMLDREIRLTYMGPLWHIPKALMAVENGGMTDDSFAIRPYCPVQFLPGRSPSKPGAAFWDSGALADWDYVLVHGDAAPSDALASKRLSLEASLPGWFLFKVNPPPPGLVIVAGGAGGAPFVMDCDEGERLTGLSAGAAAGALRWVRGRCSAGGAGPRLGDGSGGRTVQTGCAKGETLVGIHGEAGAVIVRVGAICASDAALATEGRPEREVPLPAQAAGEAGEGEVRPFRLVCPVSQVPAGLRGRAGALVDALGLRCEVPRSGTPPPDAVTAPPPARDPQGSPENPAEPPPPPATEMATEAAP